MSDPYLRHIERANGCDDVECPNEDCAEYGQLIPVGHSCEACGWSTADGLDRELEAKWDAWRDERLADDGRLWEGEA